MSDERLAVMLELVEANEAVDYYDLADALRELLKRRELEAANARLPVHDVRVEGGVIVGLGELLEGED